MTTHTITLKSKQKNQLIDITSKVREYVMESNVSFGQVILFVPHTTAAVTINENADPAVKQDILFGLNRLSPNLSEFTHYEGNSDAHIKSSLIGASEMIIIQDGDLLLGTWQGIYFCEFDGPRTRKIHLRISK
jgi:secondary thiamine-phosphate synthase enzyme